MDSTLAWSDRVRGCAYTVADSIANSCANCTTNAGTDAASVRYRDTRV